MPPAGWNALVGAPLFTGAGILIFIRPFLGASTREYAIGAAVALLAVGFGAALLRNRLTIGTWTRLITPQQRAEIRQRAYSSQIMTVVNLGALSLVGLPLVFWLRALGWSKDATLFAALLAGIPVLAVTFFLTRRFGNRRATNPPSGS
jgi:hypothetical protein